MEQFRGREVVGLNTELPSSISIEKKIHPAPSILSQGTLSWWVSSEIEVSMSTNCHIGSTTSIDMWFFHRNEKTSSHLQKQIRKTASSSGLLWNLRHMHPKRRVCLFFVVFGDSRSAKYNVTCNHTSRHSRLGWMTVKMLQILQILHGFR